jgi:tetratricopeptide (TPR) repeat protein
VKHLLPLFALPVALPVALLFALPAAPALAAPSDPTRYAACMDVAGKDPARALQLAYGWLAEGGGVPARHCLAVAQMQARHHDAALKSYEAAGIASEDARDGQAVALWRQAAEAALIAGKPAEAVRFLTRALARPGGVELSPRAEAALRIVRAEALVEAGKPAEAMADLDAATTAAPDGLAGWLLKATLHRRQGELAPAEAALLKAAALAPEDPDVELEAGNIAAARGDMTLARQAWEAAAADGPDTPAGKAAAAALRRLGIAPPAAPLTDGLTDAAPPATPR